MTIDEMISELKEAKEYFGTGGAEVFIKDKAVESIDTFKGVDGECYINIDPIK